VSQDEYQYLEMHLERENVWAKDVETIEKLFSQTEEGYTPRLVIGIQNVESSSRIELLNELVRMKNKELRLEALMIYRFYDKEDEFDRVRAYHFLENKIVEERRAICKADHLGYWVMYFEEEYK
jgi:hypothetical protein